MTETIASRTASELLQLESELIAGKLSIGRYWLLGKRMAILRKYISVCDHKNLAADPAIYYYLLELGRLRERYFALDSYPCSKNP